MRDITKEEILVEHERKEQQVHKFHEQRPTASAEAINLCLSFAFLLHHACVSSPIYMHRLGEVIRG